MSQIDDILSRLQKVKRTASGWIACCPAHEDKTPSLALRDMGDGRILVKCFAECGFEDIVNAIGMGFDAFFPPKPLGDHVRPLRRPFPAADVLECLATETRIVYVFVGDIERGVTPSEADLERFRLAVTRIQSARDVALG